MILIEIVDDDTDGWNSIMFLASKYCNRGVLNAKALRFVVWFVLPVLFKIRKMICLQPMGLEFGKHDVRCTRCANNFLRVLRIFVVIWTNMWKFKKTCSIRKTSSVQNFHFVQDRFFCYLFPLFVSADKKSSNSFLLFNINRLKCLLHVYLNQFLKQKY